MTKIDDIVYKIAKKNNLSIKQVREVIDSDFQTMIDKIKEFDYKNEKTHHIFLLPKFCKFVLNISRAKKLYGNKD